VVVVEKVTWGWDLTVFGFSLVQVHEFSLGGFGESFCMKSFKIIANSIVLCCESL
jgi:hypothetical protein